MVVAMFIGLGLGMTGGVLVRFVQSFSTCPKPRLP
jgi:hypothetical protein